MAASSWRWFGLFGLLAAISLCVPACSSDGHLNLFGYTTAPNYDTSIKTVYVPMVKNLTTLHGSNEFDLTRAIINEIQMKTPYRVVHSTNGADTELICTIKNRYKTVINENQLGETREAQLGVNLEVTWRDLRPGKVGEILSAPKRREGEPPQLDATGKEIPTPPVLLSPVTYYIPEVGGNDATARAQLWSKLATQIANMMETSGSNWRSK